MRNRLKINEFVVVEFSMKIEGLVDTSIFQIMDRDFVKGITKEMYSLDGMKGDASSQNKKIENNAGNNQNVANNSNANQIPPGAYPPPGWGQAPPMGYGWPPMGMPPQQ